MSLRKVLSLERIRELQEEQKDTVALELNRLTAAAIVELDQCVKQIKIQIERRKQNDTILLYQYRCTVLSKIQLLIKKIIEIDDKFFDNECYERIISILCRWANSFTKEPTNMELKLLNKMWRDYSKTDKQMRERNIFEIQYVSK